MKKQKKDDSKKLDQEIRNDEMAEGKSPEVVADIYKKGDRYYCSECHSELPVKQACPVCHKELDWDRILIERR